MTTHTVHVETYVLGSDQVRFDISSIAGEDPLDFAVNETTRAISEYAYQPDSAWASNKIITTTTYKNTEFIFTVQYTNDKEYLTFEIYIDDVKKDGKTFVNKRSNDEWTRFDTPGKLIHKHKYAFKKYQS
jgi:hypothetical protein